MPILLMTGFADQRERAQDLADVIRDVVTKPFTLQQIREAVSEAATSRRRPEEAETRRPEPPHSSVSSRSR